MLLFAGRYLRVLGRSLSVLGLLVTQLWAAEIPTSLVELETAEARLRITPLAHGLANPFAMAFRNNGDILVTERYSGQLRIVRNGVLLPEAVSGVPPVYGEIFRAGLMAVAVHPDDDSLVYLTYTKPMVVNDEPEQAVALVRGKLRGLELIGLEELFVAAGLDRGIAAAKLLWTPDGKLMMSVGGAYVYLGYGDYAQDPAVHYGKLLRLNDDGSAPSDNPFITSGEYLPEVYSVGHRNQIGLAWHPDTGALWAAENGPQGGDEINIIQAGENYGWPIVSLSRQYRGDWISQQRWSEQFINPEVVWWPSIAPSGMTFYSGDKIPEWQGDLLVGSMIEGRIPGSGHLERLVFNSRGEELRRESLLREFKARVSDVQQGPNGYVYILLDEERGALLRLESISRQ
ncbi:MAG: PQQ-dependent sugar dehydrogenase [Pseudohongiellaceae bacterium]